MIDRIYRLVPLHCAVDIQQCDLLRFPGQGRPGMSLYAGKQPAFAQGGHELPDIGGDNCLTWEEDVAIMGFIIE